MIIPLENKGLQRHIVDVVGQIRAAKEELEAAGISVDPTVEITFTVSAVDVGGINAVTRSTSQLQSIAETRKEAVVAKSVRRSAATTKSDDKSESTEETLRKGETGSSAIDNRKTTGSEDQNSTEKRTSKSEQSTDSSSDQESTSTDTADTNTRQINGGTTETTTKYDR